MESNVKQKPSPQTQNSEESLGEFVHQYLRDYIALADQKAAFLLAAVSAFLAYAIGEKALDALGKPFSAWSLVSVVGLLACLALMGSALIAIGVVIPRLARHMPNNTAGLIFWRDIAARRDAQDYAKALEALSSAEASRQIRLHCFALAMICQKKYQVLEWGIWAGAVGFGLTLIFLVLKTWATP